MEDAGGKSGRRPGSHLQVEAWQLLALDVAMLRLCTDSGPFWPKVGGGERARRPRRSRRGRKVWVADAGRRAGAQQRPPLGRRCAASPASEPVPQPEPEIRKKLGFEGRRVGKGGHITIAGCRQVSGGVLTAGMAAAEPLQPQLSLLYGAWPPSNIATESGVGTSAIHRAAAWLTAIVEIDLPFCRDAPC